MTGNNLGVLSSLMRLYRRAVKDLSKVPQDYSAVNYDIHPHYGKWTKLHAKNKVALLKNQKVSITNCFPNADELIVAFGWNAPYLHTDLETYAFICGAEGKVRSDADLVFYGQKRALEGAVEHLQDNTTSAGRDADEAIRVSLSKIPPDVMKVVFAANINSAGDLSQLSQIFVRLIDSGTQSVLAQHDIMEKYDKERSIVLGELCREERGWSFKSGGVGFDGVHDTGGGALMRHYGVEIK